MKTRYGQTARLHLRIMCSLALVVALMSAGLSGHVIAATAATAQEAARAALEQNGNVGKVLGVSQEVDDDGLTVYDVKILNDGRVRVIRIAHSP